MSGPNKLFFGDCLDVMREDILDDSVDLIYLGMTKIMNKRGIDDGAK